MYHLNVRVWGENALKTVKTPLGVSATSLFSRSVDLDDKLIRGLVFNSNTSIFLSASCL